MRRLAQVLSCCVLSLLQDSRPASQPRPESAPARKEDEYKVKFAYLFVLTGFIEWPAEPRDRRTFRIGILGEDPFGAGMDEVLAGKSISGRACVVQRLGPFKDLRRVDLLECDLVFVSRSERGSLAALFAQLGTGAVLTVGDAPGFARAGGMIEMYLQDQRVLFEVNQAALARGGLKASSRLLKLARLTEEEPRR